MNPILQHIARFILYFILQVFVLNKIELGFGIHLFLLPLYIMLLPFEINVFLLLFLAFVLGISVDVFSNTYGLHASSLVVFAYFRPLVFRFFMPRDGYDPLKNPSFQDMRGYWFFSVYGLLLAIYLFWFFILEYFRISEFIQIFQNVILSFIFSLLIGSGFQLFLFNRFNKK